MVTSRIWFTAQQKADLGALEEREMRLSRGRWKGGTRPALSGLVPWRIARRHGGAASAEAWERE
jgi:hypothetical protein